MILGNPVRGVIHEESWANFGKNRPAGNTDWRVTSPFGPRASGQHNGFDLGNGKCGGAVLAMASGRVHVSQRVSSGPSVGEQIVAIDHGRGMLTYYGHLRVRVVTVGARVTEGQKIGEVGTTGVSSACHLHAAVRTGVDTTRNVYADSNGRWQDPWPLLRMNQPEDDMPPLATYIPGHQATVAKGFNIRAAPELSGTVLRTTTAPEAWTVIGWVKGALASGSDQWLVRWAGTYEYVHRSGVGTIDPPATVDCSAEIAAATAPIQASLVEANSKIAAAQAALV